MTDTILDPQATGWRDDGSESGLSRVEIARGGLVAVPMRRNSVYFGTGGSASGPSFNASFSENDDGTQSGAFILVPASATLANYLMMNIWITGNVFGIRLARTSSYYSGGPVGCKIDGVAYEINALPLLDPSTMVQSTGATAPGLNAQILATDLGDGPHLVELVFPGFLTGASRFNGLLGYVVDRSAGYAPMPRGVMPLTPLALTTSPQGLLIGGQYSYGIRKVFLVNTTGTAVPVTLKFTSNGSSTAFWIRSVPANDTLEVDLGGPLYDNVFASATTTGVNAIPMGLV